MPRLRAPSRAILASPSAAGLAFVAALIAVACGDSTPSGTDNQGQQGGLDPRGFQLSCDLPPDFLFDGGVARDGIPSLVNPPLVPIGDPGLAYLDEWAAISRSQPEMPEVRVVGLVIDGEAVAVPHNVLWWHEIANIDLGGRRLAITYCPLTGSVLVFDATAAGTQRFGVSGVIFMNNLMMFDPETESLWPQMLASAKCGLRTGTQLTVVPHIEMRWEAWKALHPDTRVVSSALGFDRNYAAYPYDLYEADAFLLFPQGELDRRRFGKERVLGIPDGNGGIAFPFGELQSQGDLAVVNATALRGPSVILWDSEARAAQAYRPRTENGAATLAVVGDHFEDVESGSIWNVEGLAISGSRAGQELIKIPDAFVAFWFAWAAFHPQTELWTGR